ncbi:bifunctional metallophosphatase/5'-nucleotidase [Salinimicrobium xinjiangense]|uniref:bifunctional metallophosphatase/5'-nucleotidase n=1 Tax=Salinimicrobium xinjiangense TaxID=438596 RepID=UPI00041BD76D|nr:bifunctional UDP-sugar hydrolase/5'-nucleotidase [Salinimicrobium xinjiangense]
MKKISRVISAAEFLWKMTFLAGIVFLVSCSTEDPVTPEVETKAENIVIFSINDPHGKIHNFDKIKAIIDKEKETESQVFFVSGGDIFSGNPIVDYHPEKGSPIVDLMGKAGMDVSALGNHEFDYGQQILQDRILQASFPFLCANLVRSTSGFVIPQGKVVIEKDGFKVAFLSVVETGSYDNKPLSHPKKLEGLEFSEGVDAIGIFEDDADVKEAHLVVALTHYGKQGDQAILQQHDFVDLVIGGHNHAVYSEEVAGRVMVQSGADLKYLTKLSLTVEKGEITSYTRQLIDLDAAPQRDAEVQKLIAAYNNQPEFFVEIGTSLQDHSRAETACFYTTALQTITGADIVFQNYGGIRATLDYGKITPFDIYTIDPFQNGLDTFSMTVGEVEDFLNVSYAPSLAYSGIKMERRNGRVELITANGNLLSNSTTVTVALSDYLSHVYSQDFTQPVTTFEKTTAEYLIDYLMQHQSVIDLDGCNRGI